MRLIVLYGAFAWRLMAGVLHFAIDVIAPYIRGARIPGAETTFYYGLHSSYALGVMVFATFGLLVTWQPPGILNQWPAIQHCAVAAVVWLSMNCLFIEYKPPKVLMSTFGFFVISMAFTCGSQP